MPAPLQRLFSHMVVHFSTPNYCLCSRDHSVFKFHYQSQRLERLFRLPPAHSGLQAWAKDKLARSWLAQKLRPRPGLGHVVETPSGSVVVVYDKFYVHPRGSKESTAIAYAPTLNPKYATPLRGGIAVHPVSEKIYFGEYLNDRRRDIRIIQFDPRNGEARVCWSFSPSEIKHVHAIQHDRFRNRLWIMTGDEDHESAFYYTDDEFASVHRFAGGDQSWRAIALLFDENGMEWGMDAGKDAPASAVNHVYRYDFGTGQRTQLATIGNPAYAAVPLADGCAVMATTYEPGRLQDTPAQAALWFRGPDRTWREIHQQDYQHRGMQGISRYGMLFLATGIYPADQVLFTPVNCAGEHLSCFRLTELKSERSLGMVRAHNAK